MRRRWIGAVVWAAASLCMAWALVRTLGLERGFPLTAVIAWTPFVIPAALAVAAIAGALKRWGALTVASAATLLLAAAVLPRAFGDGHGPPGADGPTLPVLSANLKLGKADPRGVHLLLGDFNATLDHREFRDVVARGYVDAGDATGGGLRPTWPERLVRPGVTIDHVLADERIAITGYGVHELPGSDHRAVSAILRLPSG